jgi:Tol biopolymer transport system component
MANHKVQFRRRPSLHRFYRWSTAALVLCAGLAALSLRADSLQTVSARNQDIPGALGATGDSHAPLMTADGRYVVFASTARDLVLGTNGLPLQGPANPVLNVYWRDRVTQQTRLISAGWNGKELGNRDSLPAAISSDGMRVLIESAADNLAPNDTNGVSDIFICNVLSSTCLIVSIGTNGTSANGPSWNAVMKPDGYSVAFTSLANNLVPNDTNRVSDVFLRDLHSGQMSLISVDWQPSGASYTNLGADLAQITADGRKVAFVGKARNLSNQRVAAALNVRDVFLGTTDYASSGVRTALGLSSSLEATCFGHVFSDDGTFLAYEAAQTGALSPSGVFRYNVYTRETDLIRRNTGRPNLVADDVQSVDITMDGQKVAYLAETNFTDTCVLVWDAASGTSSLVSAKTNGALSAQASWLLPRFNAQGTRVTFISSAKDIVTNTLTAEYHLFERDLAAGTTAVLGTDATGAAWPVNSMNAPAFGAYGDRWFIALEGRHPELSGTHNSDVFVLELQFGTPNLAGTPDLVSRRLPVLVSTTPAGWSFPPAPSASSNGRLFAFSSTAEDLAPNDTNGVRDIFLRDILAGTNLLVSADDLGVAGNGASFDPVISGNGRFVAFSSVASNLVAGDSNGQQDIFVRDLQSGAVVLASAAYNGTPSNGRSALPVLNHDGRWLLFRSAAKNLATGTFTGENFFLRDLQRNTNFALTSGGTAIEAGGADLTPDGRFALYSFKIGTGVSYVSVWDTQLEGAVLSNAIPALANLVAIAPDGAHIAWLSNYPGGAGTVLQELSSGNSVSTLLAETGDAYVRPQFSGDSRWLVYGKQMDGISRLYLRELSSGTELLVSRSMDAPGTVASGHSDSPAISPDGRFVAFRSFAWDIVAGDLNGVPDVFLFDRESAGTVRISSQAAGDGSASGSGGNGWSGYPVFSADGSTLVFSSWASNLDPFDLNGTVDLFAYTIVPTATSFFVQATLASGQPTLAWPVTPGKTYRVQYRTDLGDASWQDAPGVVSITGTQATYIDPTPASKKFFRVLEE